MFRSPRMVLATAALALSLTAFAATGVAVTQAAQGYSGVEQSVGRYLCVPTGSNKVTLYECINKLYRVAIVVASIAGLFFLVFAGYLYMTAEGNSENVTKAKTYVQSTVAALVILLTGYLLLKAINPDLTQFAALDLANYRAGQPPAGAPPTGAPAVSADVQAAARSIQNNSRISVNSSRCDCAGNCPSNTLTALAAGQAARKDGPGTTCNTGTVSVSKAMLDGLNAVANAGNSFILESLTGGHHSANSTHYQGRAADVIPQNASASNQASLIQSLQSNGARVVAIECSLNGQSVYWPVPGSAQPNDNRCIGRSGYHIHVEW